MSDFYNPAHRQLQDEFESRPLADRLRELIIKPFLDEDAQNFIRSRNNFYLTTVDADGFPTVSHKGGASGFVIIESETSLVFPCFDGNGMWLSMGNIEAQGKVGLLFLDSENPHRVRVQGTATLIRDREILRLWPEVALAVRVTVTNSWMNCPRYIHQTKPVSESLHVPRVGVETQQAEWKSMSEVQDVVPKSPHLVKNAD
jgi:predicted pyridoxine 5'-phosphate oxidase superfamily flavin-nucleotide-binding protein